MKFAVTTNVFHKDLMGEKKNIPIKLPKQMAKFLPKIDIHLICNYIFVLQAGGNDNKNQKRIKCKALETRLCHIGKARPNFKGRTQDDYENEN